MSHLNLLFFPTLLLAFVFFAAGHRVTVKASSARLLALWFACALVSALPAALFVIYYAHLLDNAGWFYAFRALPYTELTASGLGFGTGMAAGLAQRAAARHKSAMLG